MTTEDGVLTAEELAAELATLPNWELRDGWLRRTYLTPGWPHSVLLVTTIAYLAEAAWHHPDLNVGYAQVIVKLQTHRVRGITLKDTQLARQIESAVTWKPTEADGPGLTGFPKNWVR